MGGSVQRLLCLAGRRELEVFQSLYSSTELKWNGPLTCYTFSVLHNSTCTVNMEMDMVRIKHCSPSKQLTLPRRTDVVFFSANIFYSSSTRGALCFYSVMDQCQIYLSLETKVTFHSWLTERTIWTLGLVCRNSNEALTCEPLFTGNTLNLLP